MSFAPRPLKGELPDKGPYTIRLVKNAHHNVYPSHTVTEGNEQRVYHYRQVVSIDPGKTNFGINVERRLQGDKVVPLVYHRQSFKDCPDDTMYLSMIQYLNQFWEHWENVTCVVIERQLPINYKTTRIAQHVITYFMLVLQNLPHDSCIIEVDSQLKSKIFKGPKGKRELKQWSPPLARQMFISQGNTWSVAILDAEKKKDDIADAKVQLEALIQQLKNENSPLIVFFLPPTFSYVLP